MAAVRFLKGHGTENDFVLLPDVDALLDLGPGAVVRITDRRAGLGADGVIRVVPTAAVPEVAAQAGQARWFMDYRNADGSEAEMCGNGSRLFARYLVEAGLEPRGSFAIATRGGVREVDASDVEAVTVDMGPCIPLDPTEVRVTVEDGCYTATALSMGNPHAVVPVADLREAGELRKAPVVAPASAFPHGVNVEFVVGRGPGRIAMRVYERGVGETRSCGTGACAAAAAAAGWWGAALDYRVEVPGGVVEVRRTSSGSLTLTGPAVFVASGELDPRLWHGSQRVLPAGSGAQSR